MAWYHKAWHIFLKHWAYTFAGILCLCAVALLSASCGTIWYTSTGHGYLIIPSTNETIPLPTEYYFDYTINEYILHLTFDVEISNYYGSNSYSYNCKYTDYCYTVFTGTPSSPGQPPWDLTKYKPTYAAIFAMTLTAIVLTVIIGILVEVICWTTGRIPHGITLGLTIAALSITLFLLGVLLVDWCLLFNHPWMSRSSISVSDTLCEGGDSNDLAAYGFLCDWNGNWQYDQYRITYENFFYSEFRDLHQVWGPSTAWVLLTIAFGLIGFVLLLIAGWWPSNSNK